MATPAAGNDMAWLVYALLALCSFAVNNFLISLVAKEAGESGGSTVASEASVTGMIVIWMVAGMCGIGGAAYIGLEPLQAGLKGRDNVLLGAFTGLVNMTAMLTLSLALASDPDSAGPITAMLPLGSVIVSALAWFVLGETLGKQEIVGVVVAVLGPMFMAAADTSGAALTGIGLGGLTALCFGCSNFLRKLLAMRGVASNCIVVLLFLTVGSGANVAVIVSLAARGGMPGLVQPVLVFYILVSGFLWVAGGLFFQWALVGKAGPASAVTNTNSAGVLLLTLVCYRAMPPPLKIFGMCCCIAGVTLLSLKPRGPPPAPARDLDVGGGESFATALRRSET